MPSVSISPAAALRALYWGAALLLLAAWLGPAVPQPQDFHAFADQRAWGALPHALDVLSNLGFAWAAVAGARLLLDRRSQALAPALRWLAALFFTGLACSAIGSSVYHWAPHDATLAGDRLGMSMAFAGMLGLALQSRIADRVAVRAAVAMLLAAVASVLVWLHGGNLLPWALVQGGGMLAVLGLACVAPRHGALALRLGLVIAWYGAAKLLEWGDAAVFEATAGLVSGHSLKHVVAAAAALPVITALRAAGTARMGSTGTMCADACGHGSATNR